MSGCRQPRRAWSAAPPSAPARSGPNRRLARLVDAAMGAAVHCAGDGLSRRWSLTPHAAAASVSVAVRQRPLARFALSTCYNDRAFGRPRRQNPPNASSGWPARHHQHHSPPGTDRRMGLGEVVGAPQDVRGGLESAAGRPRWTRSTPGGGVGADFNARRYFAVRSEAPSMVLRLERPTFPSTGYPDRWLGVNPCRTIAMSAPTA